MYTLPTLTSERLTLRPFRQEDVALYYDIYWRIAYPQESPTLQVDEHPTLEDLGQENEFYLRFGSCYFLEGLGRWFIYLRSSEQAIGMVMLHPHRFSPEQIDRCVDPETGCQRIGSLEVNRSIALTYPHRGMGYGTEAGRLINHYGLETLRLAQIVTFTNRQNLASLNVIRKCGFEIIIPADGDEIYGIKRNIRRSLEGGAVAV